MGLAWLGAEQAVICPERWFKHIFSTIPDLPGTLTAGAPHAAGALSAANKPWMIHFTGGFCWEGERGSGKSPLLPLPKTFWISGWGGGGEALIPSAKGVGLGEGHRCIWG